MTKPFLSIIIPTYNEEKRIEKCLVGLSKYLSKVNFSYEVIFVNDQSHDKTLEILEEKTKNIKNYQIINNKINRGKGYAVRLGILASRGENVLFCDADLSTPISELDKLLPFLDQYQIVIGSRYLNKNSIEIKQPLIRRIISRLGNILVRIVLGLNYSDTQCGFKLFNGGVAKDIFSRVTIERWGFDMELLAIAKLLGYKIKEVAVSWHDDTDSKVRAGQAAISTFKELWKIRTNILYNRYRKPL